MDFTFMGKSLASSEVLLSAGLTLLLEIILIIRAKRAKRMNQLVFFSMFVIIFSFLGFYFFFATHECITLLFPLMGGVMPIWMIGSVGLTSNGRPVRDDDGKIKTHTNKNMKKSGFDDGSDTTINGGDEWERL